MCFNHAKGSVFTALRMCKLQMKAHVSPVTASILHDTMENKLIYFLVRCCQKKLCGDRGDRDHYYCTLRGGGGGGVY